MFLLLEQMEFCLNMRNTRKQQDIILQRQIGRLYSKFIVLSVIFMTKSCKSSQQEQVPWEFSAQKLKRVLQKDIRGPLDLHVKHKCQVQGQRKEGLSYQQRCEEGRGEKYTQRRGRWKVWCLKIEEALCLEEKVTICSYRKSEVQRRDPLDFEYIRNTFKRRWPLSQSLCWFQSRQRPQEDISNENMEKTKCIIRVYVGVCMCVCL